MVFSLTSLFSTNTPLSHCRDTSKHLGLCEKSWGLPSALLAISACAQHDCWDWWSHVWMAGVPHCPSPMPTLPWPNQHLLFHQCLVLRGLGQRKGAGLVKVLVFPCSYGQTSTLAVLLFELQTWALPLPGFWSTGRKVVVLHLFFNF